MSDYGLVRGLRAEVRASEFRCNLCRKMQRPLSLLVWVPDGVKVGDPAWSITGKALKVSKTSSSWCLECARSLTSEAPVTPERSFLRRIFGGSRISKLIAAIAVVLALAFRWGGAMSEATQQTARRPDDENFIMTHRALCIHGKVRAMMVDPRPDHDAEYVKMFKKEMRSWGSWANTIDQVSVIEARKSDMHCSVCDAKKPKRFRGEVGA